MKLTPSKPINTGDNLGRGMELALATLLFFGVGYALDRWLGTQPLFTIGLVSLSLIGQFARLRYAYDAAMQAHEDERERARHDSRHDSQPGAR